MVATRVTRTLFKKSLKKKMVKKCIYCSTKIDSGLVVDMCQRCMYQVWGEKMTKAIIEGMEKERDVGNLDSEQSNNIIEKSEIVVNMSKEEVARREMPMYSDNFCGEDSPQDVEVVVEGTGDKLSRID